MAAAMSERTTMRSVWSGCSVGPGDCVHLSEGDRPAATTRPSSVATTVRPPGQLRTRYTSLNHDLRPRTLWPPRVNDLRRNRRWYKCQGVALPLARLGTG